MPAIQADGRRRKVLTVWVTEYWQTYFFKAYLSAVFIQILRLVSYAKQGSLSFFHFSHTEEKASGSEN